MNNTVILSELAAAVAELTQCTVEDAENFIRETFRLAAENLESDRRAVIPGVGAFIVTDESIAFAPEQKLAEELNAPFAAFEAVELPEEYDESDDATNREEPAEPAAQTPEVDETIEEAPEAETPRKSDAEEAENVEPVVTAAPDTAPETAPEDEPEDVPEGAPEEEVAVTAPKSQTSHHWIWAAACLLCFVLGWFARGFAPGMTPSPQIAAETETTDLSDESDPSDTIVPEEVVPARPVITDTIAPGRFLTTMARAHYGRMEFWVYIYEANAGKLGHPDRLNAGTVVVIPPADSLGLNVKDEAHIDAAERKAAEIYARFN